MKINNQQYNEIVKYFKDKFYKPDISDSLFKKKKDFSLKSDALYYKNRIVVSKEKINEVLRVQYKKYSFGRDKLFSTVKRTHEGISKLDVVSFLGNSQTNQLHKVAPKERIRQPIITKRVLERVQFDLIDLNSIKGFNYQNRYILTGIDHFSKYAFAYPLTKKTESMGLSINKNENPHTVLYQVATMIIQLTTAVFTFLKTVLKI